MAVAVKKIGLVAWRYNLQEIKSIARQGDSLSYQSNMYDRRSFHSVRCRRLVRNFNKERLLKDIKGKGRRKKRLKYYVLQGFIKTAVRRTSRSGSQNLPTFDQRTSRRVRRTSRKNTDIFLRLKFSLSITASTI